MLKRRHSAIQSDSDATGVVDLDVASLTPPSSAHHTFSSGYATLHERNIYLNSPPDFGALSQQFDFLAPHVFTPRSSGVPCIDWRKADSLLALTRALLARDFGVEFDMPLNHLCPPIPQRLNYLLWIEDLLTLSGLDRKQYRLRGVDIGCGASFIFPLLGASHFGFSFVGTEVDPESVESARANINRNPHLAELLEVRLVEDRLKILVDIVRDDETFEFCCCNPPFFESLSETQLNKKRSANATASELTCPGGELVFVNRLFEDSVQLRYQFRWFTTMLGKKVTLDALKRRIATADGITCVRHCEFQQGKQTRWGLAWSFDPGLPASMMPLTHVKDRFKLEVSLEMPSTALNALEVISANLRLYGASRVETNTSAFAIDAEYQCDDNSAANWSCKVQMLTLPGRQLELDIRRGDIGDATSFSRMFQSLKAALTADIATFRSVRS